MSYKETRSEDRGNLLKLLPKVLTGAFEILLHKTPMPDIMDKGASIDEYGAHDKILYPNEPGMGE